MYPDRGSLASRRPVSTHWSIRVRLLAIAVFAASLLPIGTAGARSANIAFPLVELEQRLDEQPFEILEAKPSRGLKNEVGLKARVRFPDGVEMALKIRPAAPGASEFNNEPRYELAAYRLQSLFLEPDDYVVPPTALRMLPRSALVAYAPGLRPTFKGSDDVLVVVQYWMENVEGKGDILDKARFATDPEYARRFGEFNLLTYAIKHGDSNLGNVLISTVPGEPRVWAVDNGVAFNSPESDRGNAWSKIRVDWLPAATMARFGELDRDRLTDALAVLGEWRLVDGHYQPVTPGENLSKGRGVRTKDDRVQLGLTSLEIRSIERRVESLVKQVDKGKLEVR
jgi:hypothetical protein